MSGRLPKGQDVIADGASVLGWTDGSLPSLDLELAAAELFADAHPRQLWSDPSMGRERDQARRQILRAHVRFLKSSRWTLSNMVDRLEAEFSAIVCGDRAPSPGEQQQLREYAESCIEDLFKVFGGDAIAKSLSHSWRHVPEDEPDESELEDLGPVTPKTN